MSKPTRPREEPKLRIDELENESTKIKKKEWPKDEGDNKESKISKEEIDFVGILEHPSYKELEKKLTEMELKANEYWNEKLRSQAELENVRRRVERDVANAHKYSLEKFVSDLLPIVDSLERALLSEVHGNEYAENIHKGIELTMSMLLKTLERFGVKQINPVGETFNPELHQAIATQPSGSVAANSVIEVLQKGYALNDRLIRPALVVVSAKG